MLIIIIKSNILSFKENFAIRKYVQPEIQRCHSMIFCLFGIPEKWCWTPNLPTNITTDSIQSISDDGKRKKGRKRFKPFLSYLIKSKTEIFVNEHFRKNRICKMLT